MATFPGIAGLARAAPVGGAAVAAAGDGATKRRITRAVSYEGALRWEVEAPREYCSPPAARTCRPVPLIAGQLRPEEVEVLLCKHRGPCAGSRCWRAHSSKPESAGFGDGTWLSLDFGVCGFRKDYVQWFASQLIGDALRGLRGVVGGIRGESERHGEVRSVMERASDGEQ